MADQIGDVHEPVSFLVQTMYPVRAVQMTIIGDLADGLGNALPDQRVHLLRFNIRPIKALAKPHRIFFGRHRCLVYQLRNGDELFTVIVQARQVDVTPPGHDAAIQGHAGTDSHRNRAEFNRKRD